MYTRRNLPVEKEEEIATPARISKWYHLKPISNEIVQDAYIYAYKTLLGWCIVGPIINTETERSISSHHVAVKDVRLSRLAHITLEFRNLLRILAWKKCSR